MTRTHPALAELTEDQRRLAMSRFAVLRPHLEGGVPLPRVAAEAGVALRSLEHWLARYPAGGVVSLARPTRVDRGRYRLPPDFVTFIEGLFLRRPAPSIATVHRAACDLADSRD